MYTLTDFQSRFEYLLSQYRNPVLKLDPLLCTSSQIGGVPASHTATVPSTSTIRLSPTKCEIQIPHFKQEPHISSPENETLTQRPAKAVSASPLKRHTDSSLPVPKMPRRAASTDQNDHDGNGGTKFQEGVTVGYTYDALFISDGRSKRRVNPISQKDHQRYTCNICQKSYATSSNLSRHKQTHRALDSNFAKKCPDCGKIYVSMPALSMHLLTHKLEHKCEVCFSLHLCRFLF